MRLYILIAASYVHMLFITKFAIVFVLFRFLVSSILINDLYLHMPVEKVSIQDIYLLPWCHPAGNYQD